MYLKKMEKVLDEIFNRQSKLTIKGAEKPKLTLKNFLSFIKDSGIENFVDVLEVGNYFNTSIKMQLSHVLTDRFTKM